MIHLPRILPSRNAELAAATLMRLLGSFRHVQIAQPPQRSRVAGLLLTPLRYQLFLPHFVAIAEDFVRTSLMDWSEKSMPARPSRLVQALWAAGQKETERSWDDVRGAFSKWHGISLSAFPQYDDFQACVDARNAIVHGVGYLTPRQLRRDVAALRKRLIGFGISLSGTQLILDEPSIRNCAITCREFILWTDLNLQGQPAPAGGTI